MTTNSGDELGKMSKIYFKGAKVLDDVVQRHMVGKVSMMLIESWLTQMSHSLLMSNANFCAACRFAPDSTRKCGGVERF